MLNYCFFQSNIKNKANKAKKKDDFNAQYESGLATAGGDKAAPKCNGVAIDSKSNFSGGLDCNILYFKFYIHNQNIDIDTMWKTLILKLSCYFSCSWRSQKLLC